MGKKRLAFVGVLAVCAVVSSFAGGPLSGGPTSHQAQEKIDLKLQHEVTVTLKLIQVYVTDKAGRPVGDLAPADFEVWDNGQLQKIKAFENHVLPPTEGAGPAPVVSAADVISPPPPAAPPAMGRKFYFIFDLFRNDPMGLKLAKGAALTLLKTLRPEDEVSVLSFSSLKGLTVRTLPTADKEKTAGIISRIKEPTYFKSFDPKIDPKLSEEKSTGEGDVNPDIMELDGILTDYFGSLTDLARALRTAPGFKHIVLFSLGLSRALVYGRSTGMFTNDMNSGNVSDPEAFAEGLMEGKQGSLVASQFTQTMKEMASANCLIYSVNTESNRAFLITGDRDLQGKNTLKALSEETGGRYYDSANQYEAVAESIQNVTKSYYVVGYYVSEQWDGRYHEVKVNVTRKDLTVTAQKGYFNPKPYAQLTDFEKQLHLLDLVLKPMPSVIPVTALTIPADKGASALLLSEVEPDLIPEAARKRSEIIEMVLDVDENVVWSRRGEVSLFSLSSKSVFPYAFLNLKAGTYQCKTIIRNLETGEAAVGTTSVSIADAPTIGLELYSPLILSAGTKPLFLKAASKAKGEPDLSLQSLYPFVPAHARPVMGEVESKPQDLFFVIRCSVLGVANPNLKFSISLVNQGNGEAIALVHKKMTAARDGHDLVALAEVPLPALPPGEYRLALAAEETSSGARSETSTPLRVRHEN